MTETTKATLSIQHPSSPHRDRLSLFLLLFGVFAGPVAWGVQLIVNYALAVHPCFPGEVARLSPLPGWHPDLAGILVINIIAAIVALAGAALSSQRWNTERHRHSGSIEALTPSEGRTRFLALCGMMTGFGFFAAIIFNTIAMAMVPQCSG